MSGMRALLLVGLASVLLSCQSSSQSGAKPSPDGGSDSRQPGAGIRPADTVSVEFDPYLKQTTYSIARDDCRICWVVYPSEANRGVIKHGSECRLQLADQAPLFEGLLEKLLADAAEPGVYRTLFWGRLYPDGKPSPEMAMRLMSAAKRTAAWDAVRGSPENDDYNGFVRDLLNDASAYEELRAVFRKSGLDLRVSSVEKVLVTPAGDLPFFNQFQGGEIEATDRLPFDCMTWFAITAAEP